MSVDAFGREYIGAPALVPQNEIVSRYQTDRYSRESMYNNWREDRCGPTSTVLPVRVPWLTVAGRQIVMPDVLCVLLEHLSLFNQVPFPSGP